ncbi:MAG: M56 family metallopeptidase [Bryobacteraceae bacterium]|jgi:TonB family protein
MELHSLVFKTLADASVRSLVLALAALAAMWLARARSAPFRHAVWTAVTCAMLLLPVLSVALPSIPLRILPAAPEIALPAAPAELSGRAQIQAAPAPAPPRPQRDWTSIAFPAWLLVALASLGRLVLGYAGSRRLVRGSTPIRDPLVSEALERLRAMPAPALAESESISVPLTLGWIEPYILLPPGWRTWDRTKMEAVLAHEIAHVRRSDWLVAMLAGVNRSLFWFHPLAWWMERRLTALAEEACDESSLEATGNRERYAEVLLEMAEAVRSANGRLTSQAVAMARRSQVRQRIETVLDERRRISRGMTKARWAAMLLCGVPLVASVAAIHLQSAPAQAPAPPASAAPKTPEAAVQGAKLIHRVPPAYPPLARQARVTGVVRVEATVGVDGRVRKAAAISGPPLLRLAAEQAVTKWVFEPALHRGQPVEVTTQVDVNFTLTASLGLEVERSEGQLLLKWNDEGDLLRDPQRATLTIIDGDHTEHVPLDPAQLRSGSVVYAPATDDVQFRLEVVSREGKSASASARVLVGQPRKRTEELGVGKTGGVSGGISSGISGGISGGVAGGAPSTEAQVIHRVPPAYPLLARQDRVTGVVRVEATIGADGRVRKAAAISGPPLLRQAAVEAVIQWVYRPALLDGKPVEVVTQVDVNFTLTPSLGLKIEQSDGQLLLKWNDEGDLLRDAQRATLTIIDGDHTEDVPLDLATLRSGSIVYAPLTADVQFRLEVVSREGKSASASAQVRVGQR